MSSKTTQQRPPRAHRTTKGIERNATATKQFTPPAASSVSSGSKRAEEASSASRPLPNPVALVPSDVSGGNSQLTFLETYVLVSREWARNIEEYKATSKKAGSIKNEHRIEALKLCADIAENMDQDDTGPTGLLIRRLQDEKRRQVECTNRQSQLSGKDPTIVTRMPSLSNMMKRAGVDIEEDEALALLRKHKYLWIRDGRCHTGYRSNVR